MPETRLIQTTQYVDCQTEYNGVAILTRLDSYEMSLLPEERVSEDEDVFAYLNPDTLLNLGELNNGDDISLQYSEAAGPFSRQCRVQIRLDELIDNCSIRLNSKLDFNLLGRLFRNSPGLKFPFSVMIRREINLDELKTQGFIYEEIFPIVHGRSYRIQNRLRSNDLWGTPILLNNYPKLIGDLRTEIIRSIDMFSGARSESWKVSVDSIELAFTADTYSLAITRALREQAYSVFERIPSFLSRSYQWDERSPLEVVVTIPEVEINRDYRIDAHLFNPAEELFYPSGIPIIDTCLQNIHAQLLENGIPIDPGTEIYQRLLRQLLSYRYHCARTSEYISPSIISHSEISGFHCHLNSKLADQLDTTTLDIVNEQQLGNSRVDMMIAGYPVELKLEDRRTASTDDIVRRYEGQAADYVARQGCRFGFLMVLDTVLDRRQPTASLDQDVRFRHVQTASGQSVIVIAIVIRIPRSASDLTALRR